MNKFSTFLSSVCCLAVVTIPYTNARRHSASRVHGRTVEVSEEFVRDNKCFDYRNLPFECREVGCSYDCSEERCDLPDRTIHCSKCGAHCYDPCGCVQQEGCYYNSLDNRCREGGRPCSYAFFDDARQFQTTGKYYVRAGTICKNMENGMEAPIQYSTHFGVHFNTNKSVISGAENFKYFSKINTPVLDNFQIEKRRYYPGITALNPQDQELYEYFVVANDAKRKAGRCITFMIPRVLAGMYEVCIKTAEPVYKSARRRAFNVRFMNQLVIHEVDVLSLAGGKNIGIDICFTYEIKKDKKTIKILGLPEIIAFHDQLPLSICYGKCRNTSDASFIFSAIHVAAFE